MTQEVFPEIQAATQALEKQIALTEREIDQMKETIAGKKQLVKGWRKAEGDFGGQSETRRAKQEAGGNSIGSAFSLTGSSVRWMDRRTCCLLLGTV